MKAFRLARHLAGVHPLYQSGFQCIDRYSVRNELKKLDGGGGVILGVRLYDSFYSQSTVTSLANWARRFWSPVKIGVFTGPAYWTLASVGHDAKMAADLVQQETRTLHKAASCSDLNFATIDNKLSFMDWSKTGPVYRNQAFLAARARLEHIFYCRHHMMMTEICMAESRSVISYLRQSKSKDNWYPSLTANYWFNASLDELALLCSFRRINNGKEGVIIYNRPQRLLEIYYDLSKDDASLPALELSVAVAQLQPNQRSGNSE